MKRRSSRLRDKRLAKKLKLEALEKVKDPSGVLFSLPKNESLLKNQDEVIDWSSWFSATSTKNYLLDDGFLDILSTKSSSVINSNPDYSKDIGKMINLATNTTGFVPSLLNSGNTFERKVIELLTKELGVNNVRDIGGNYNPRSTQKYRETINALNSGIPCIFQGILRNYDNNTYGVTDVLIRSDWINNFLDINALSQDELKVSAPKLNNPEKNSVRFRRSKNKNVRYHYVVVDIKYKTLPLRSDGIHLRNDSIMKAYKSQLWVYNQALSKIQGYCPPYAFILGSKWKYTASNKTFKGNSCFERLGRIDYAKLDKEYIEKTRLAIEWLKDVKVNGDSWDLSKYPLPRDELYPNMCNRHDYPYHGIKRSFAENNSDLTLIWNIGPKQRRIANKNGIYTWEDKKCSPKTLGINGKMQSKVIGRILEANHSEVRNIYPKYVSNNFSDWKNQEGREIELYVDFETTCSVFSEMEELPLSTGEGLIFLIGAGYIHPITKEWTFNKFVVNSIDEDEEFRICQEFINFVDELKRTYNINKSLPLWHFSHAEPSFWKRAFERNNRKITKTIKRRSENMEWADLMKVFLIEPIGVKGCLSYNLKTLSKNFHKHGYISTTWDAEGSCVDGADAAVGAFRANLECLKNRTSFADHSLTLDIIKYNEVDTKVLQEILDYLREHHIKPNQDNDDFEPEINEEYNRIFENEIDDIESVEEFSSEINEEYDRIFNKGESEGENKKKSKRQKITDEVEDEDEYEVEDEDDSISVEIFD